MKKCIKCGLAISDTATKCPYCGAEQKKRNFCPKCGKPLVDSSAKFCNACGYSFKSVPNSALRWRKLVLPFVTFVAIIISIIAWNRNPKSPIPQIETKVSATEAKATQEVTSSPSLSSPKRSNIGNTTALCDTISAGDNYTVGLKSDGTVVAVGDNSYGQRDVNSWTDIVSISASTYHTVGLKSDGTVVAVGDNDYGQCDVDNWTDIVAISAADYHTVGLKSDGTVVVAYAGPSSVDTWSNIKLPAR